MPRGTAAPPMLPPALRLLLSRCRGRPDLPTLAACATRLLHTMAAAGPPLSQPSLVAVTAAARCRRPPPLLLLLSGPVPPPVTFWRPPLATMVRALHSAVKDGVLLCEQQQEQKKKKKSTDSEGKGKQEKQDDDKNRKEFATRIIVLLMLQWMLMIMLNSQQSNRMASAVGSTSSPRLLLSWQDACALMAAGEVSGVILRSDLGLAQLQLQPGALLDGQPVETGTTALLCLTRACAGEVGQLLGLPDQALHDFLAKAHFFGDSAAVAEFKRSLRQLEAQLLVPESDRLDLHETQGPGNPNFLMLMLVLANLFTMAAAFTGKGGWRMPKQVGSRAASQMPGGWPMNDLRSMLDPFTFKVASPGGRSASQVRFKDVAGLHEAKQELEEFVQYLREPKRFQSLGARLPHGALLLGPPGCGKTLLVKALANEASVPFFYMAGPEFVEVIGGLGASRVRRLFREARDSAPCIIFIDELDAIGRKRSVANSEFGGQGEMDQTLNQLLVEMDGMDTTVGVVCFAATNRHEVLDTALLRPGRFDRHILIDLPTLIERQELFSLYLSQYRLATLPDQFSKRLAALTPGRSGADIANICNEAALVAARRSKPAVEATDFDAALERAAATQSATPTSGGRTPTTPEERERTAYAEAGKALVAWLLETPPPVVRVSIVPRRGGTGGLQRLSSDRKLYTRQALMEAIACMLAGRAAETVAFNTVSSAGYGDTRAATNLAYRLVRELGMSDRIGHLSFEEAATSEEAPVRPYSKRTEALFDSEAQAVLGQAFRLARDALVANRDRLDRLAKALLEKEELGHEQLVRLLGESPHPKPGLAEILDWAKA